MPIEETGRHELGKADLLRLQRLAGAARPQRTRPASGPGLRIVLPSRPGRLKSTPLGAILGEGGSAET